MNPLKFIQLTQAVTKKTPVFVNVSHIIHFTPRTEGGSNMAFLDIPKIIEIMETPEEIMKLISEP